MKPKIEFTICHTVMNPNLIEFKEAVDLFKVDIQDKIRLEVYSTTVISGRQGNQVGFITIPSWYVEWFVTEQEYKSWKFTQKIMT